MKKDVYYCIVLSDSQLDFLTGSKYGIDRMKVLKCLIDAVVIKETKYEKKGFAVTLHIGQAALSEVELATRLGCHIRTDQPHKHTHRALCVGMVYGQSKDTQSVLRERERAAPLCRRDWRQWYR